ncbi:MAG: hypothetical protein LUG21_01105, partial [Clostridiales bacterium]|nr:hypothetical protein [Clostridiales bacterium]
SWLMISFNKNRDMYFKGKSAPMAFVDISVFGSPSEEQCEKMTQAVCSILNGELNIPADMIYVKFSGTNLWGLNNMMF